MDKKLPIYQLVISDDLESGVKAVALVDHPAIERYWLAFAKQTLLRFEVISESQHIISGPIMIPDMLIYRNASESYPEHYVTFSPDTIKQCVYKFFRENNGGNVNLEHAENTNGVFLFESFLINKERGILAPEKFKDLPEGTWYGSYKVDNPTVWDDFIATGVFKGFSVEGFFAYQKKDNSVEELLSAIEEILKS